MALVDCLSWNASNSTTNNPNTYPVSQHRHNITFTLYIYKKTAIMSQCRNSTPCKSQQHNPAILITCLWIGTNALLATFTIHSVSEHSVLVVICTLYLTYNHPIPSYLHPSMAITSCVGLFDRYHLAPFSFRLHLAMTSNSATHIIVTPVFNSKTSALK